MSTKAREDHTPASAIKDRLKLLEDRRLVLEAEIETSAAPAPRLHPNLALVYREKVASLTQAALGRVPRRGVAVVGKSRAALIAESVV